MSRIAALFVPLFPLAALLRSNPGLAGQPVAVCEGNDAAARLAAVSRPARKVGVRAGMSLAQARAIFPDLTVRGRDPVSERSAHEALLEVADGLSPCVEDAADDLVLAGVDGMERLFPGPGGEAELAALARRAAARLGLFIRAGIAGSRLAARLAARRPATVTIVAAGDEAAFLAPLPTGVLDPTPSLEQRLRRWGIATLGELARLPAPDVVRRLGAEGGGAHRAARGEDPTPLVPRHPEPVLTEGMALEWPVLTLEPLMLTIGELAGRLMRRLDAAGAACTLLEIELELEPGGADRHEIRLPAPSTDVRALVAIARLDLESNPPQAPVAGVRCTAHPDRPRRAQLTLFGAPEIPPSELAAVLARATARLGPGRVGSPRVANNHAPGAVDVVSFDPPPPPKVRPAHRHRSPGLLAVRTLRPPVPLEVIVDEGNCSNGGTSHARIRPVSLRSPAGAALHIQGLIRVAAGPWWYEAGWWSETPMDREYWDVEVSDGRLYRIFRDHPAGNWYADGVYD